MDETETLKQLQDMEKELQVMEDDPVVVMALFKEVRNSLVL
jgi:hypothetical protein